MVAAVFGPDQRMLGELLITVPEGMDQATLVDQVIQLAQVEGILIGQNISMVYVAMRPAEEEDQQGPKERRTYH